MKVFTSAVIFGQLCKPVQSAEPLMNGPLLHHFKSAISCTIFRGFLVIQQVPQTDNFSWFWWLILVTRGKTSGYLCETSQCASQFKADDDQNHFTLRWDRLLSWNRTFPGVFAEVTGLLAAFCSFLYLLSLCYLLHFCLSAVFPRSILHINIMEFH